MVRTCASGLRFDSIKSDQTKDQAYNIGIHSFPVWRSALKDQCGEKSASLPVLPLAKTYSRVALYYSGRQMDGNY